MLSSLVELSHSHSEFLPAELEVVPAYSENPGLSLHLHGRRGSVPSLALRCVTAFQYCKSPQRLLDARHVFPRLRTLRLEHCLNKVYVMPQTVLRFAATLTFLELVIDYPQACNNLVLVRKLPALKKLALKVRNTRYILAYTGSYDAVLVDYAQKYAAAALTKPEVAAVRAAAVAATADLPQATSLEPVMFARILALPESNDHYCLVLQELWKSAANITEVCKRVRFEQLFQEVCAVAVQPGGRLQYVRVTLNDTVPFWLHWLAARRGSVRQLLVVYRASHLKRMYPPLDWKWYEMHRQLQYGREDNDIVADDGTNKKGPCPSCGPATLPAHPHRLVVGEFGRGRTDNKGWARDKSFALYDFARQRVFHSHDGPIWHEGEEDLDTFDGWI